MLPRKGGPDSFSTLGAITEFQLRPGHILYNRKRRHSYLGYVSPAEYELLKAA